MVPGPVPAMIGEQFSLRLAVEDPDDSSLTLTATVFDTDGMEHELNESHRQVALTSSSVGQTVWWDFQWSPPDRKPYMLKFEVYDPHGSVSVYWPELQFCDCKNGGTCVTDNLPPSVSRAINARCLETNSTITLIFPDFA